MKNAQKCDLLFVHWDEKRIDNEFMLKNIMFYAKIYKNYYNFVIVIQALT